MAVKTMGCVAPGEKNSLLDHFRNILAMADYITFKNISFMDFVHRLVF